MSDVRVRVVLEDGSLEDLRCEIEQGNAPFELEEIVAYRELGGSARLFRGGVEAGPAVLRAFSDEGHLCLAYEVDIDAPRVSMVVHLRGDNLPIYAVGRSIVQFEPLSDLVGVVFETRPPGPDDARALVDRLEAQFGLTPFDLYDFWGAEQTSGEAPFSTARGSIWVLQKAEQVGDAEVEQLLRSSEVKARVGLPVDLRKGRVKVLDRRIVVNARGEWDFDLQQRFADSGLRLIRTLSSRDFVFEIADGSVREMLSGIREWRSWSEIETVEPDLLAQVAAASPVLPNDPEFGSGSQLNLENQKFPEAWEVLQTQNPDITFGSNDVVVAIFDHDIPKKGKIVVRVDHTDIPKKPLQPDNTHQVVGYFNFLNFSDSPMANWPYHGLQMYGLQGAATDNDLRIAGIAPNVHYLLVERPFVWSSFYGAALAWCAGLAPSPNPPPGWPEGDSWPPPNWPELPEQPADVICCAQTLGSSDVGGFTHYMQRIVDEGRGGLGSVVVFAAGNDGDDVTVANGFAADANTIAVSNCLMPNGAGVEVHAVNSNFGEEIDLCANGEGALTLMKNRYTDKAEHGATGDSSAACAMVSGAVALLLSKSAGVSWQDVRDALRDGAEQVDPAHASWNAAGTFSARYGFGRLNVETSIGLV